MADHIEENIMKKNTAFALVLLVLAFSVLACGFLRFGEDGNGQTITGTGSVVAQERDVSGISGVELAMSGTLHISMGSTPSLRIEAQDNLMQYIETDVRGGTLLIRNTPGYDLRSTRPIQYYLTVEKLDNIEVSSTGDIEVGNLKSDSLSIRSSSSGNIKIDGLDSSSLDVKISSSGEVEISGGQVQKQNIEISSSGDYQARDMASATADINLTSSGTTTVQVSDRLSGHLSSSGNIYYVGSPEVDVRMTSSGKTIQVDQ
jgi:hypothetical protein